MAKLPVEYLFQRPMSFHFHPTQFPFLTRVRHVVVGLMSLWLAHSGLATDDTQCLEVVTSSPTDSSMQVTLISATEYPEVPYCSKVFTGNRSDGVSYRWQAILGGDGLHDADQVNVTIALSYEQRMGSELIGRKLWVLNLQTPFPSDGFAFELAGSAGTEDTYVPPRDEPHDYTFESTGRLNPIPELSWEGLVSLNSNGLLTATVTFTGGNPPDPTQATRNLIEFLETDPHETSPLETALLAKLQVALNSIEEGRWITARHQLQALTRQVQAARGKQIAEPLAQDILAATLSILEILN